MKKISLLALLLIATVLHAQEAKVYYPAENPAPVASIQEAPHKGSPVATSILYLIFLGSMGYVAYLMWKKRTHPQASLKKADQNLQIMTTRPLGNRQFLVVVKYNQQELLLGVGQGFITRLDNKDVCTCKD